MIAEKPKKQDGMFAYCAHCREGSMPGIITYLQDKHGCRAFTPMYQMAVVRRDYEHLELRPLTPGYLLFYSDSMIEKPSMLMLKRIASVLEYADGSSELAGDDYSYAMWLYRHDGTIGLSQAAINKTNKSWIDFISGPITELGRIVRVDRRHRFAIIERVFMGEAKTYALSFEWIA